MEYTTWGWARMRSGPTRGGHELVRSQHSFGWGHGQPNVGMGVDMSMPNMEVAMVASRPNMGLGVDVSIQAPGVHTWELGCWLSNATYTLWSTRHTSISQSTTCPHMIFLQW